MKRDGIVVAGYYGFGNAGDELILRSLVDQLHQADHDAPITVLSRAPDATRRHFGVNAVNRWRPWEWFGPLRHARRFILGGGGLLQETSGPWNHVYYLSLAVIAKMMGCRVEVRAIGVDAVQNRINRWFTRFAFNQAVDAASVRDAGSQIALEDVGVRAPVARVPDLVFQLSVPSVERSGERIAMSLAPWPRRPGWEHDLALISDRIAETLKVSVELIPFFPAEDAALCDRVAELTARGAAVRPWSAAEDLLPMVARYELVIGMRYHALVLAALAEKPFIGWGFQRKVRSLCRDFGQGLWSFERGWDADAVLRQVSEAWRHRDLLPQRYKARLPELKSAVPVLNDVPRIFPSQV